MLLKYNGETGIGQTFPFQKGETEKKEEMMIPSKPKTYQGKFH